MWYSTNNPPACLRLFLPLPQSIAPETVRTAGVKIADLTRGVCAGEQREIHLYRTRAFAERDAPYSPIAELRIPLSVVRTAADAAVTRRQADDADFIAMRPDASHEDAGGRLPAIDADMLGPSEGIGRDAQGRMGPRGTGKMARPSAGWQVGPSCPSLIESGGWVTDAAPKLSFAGDIDPSWVVRVSGSIRDDFDSSVRARWGGFKVVPDGKPAEWLPELRKGK